MPERIMSRTSVETEHIPPAPVLVASTKKPSDVVDQRHGVRADAVREHLTVRRGLAPVHERRRRELDVLRVRQVRRVAYPVRRRGLLPLPPALAFRALAPFPLPLPLLLPAIAPASHRSRSNVHLTLGVQFGVRSSIGVT